MSDLLTHIRRFELVDVDLDKEPQCEGLGHPSGEYWHDDGPAKFVLTFRCQCGSSMTTLKCAGMAAYYRALPSHCGACKHVYLPSEIRFVEL